MCDAVTAASAQDRVTEIHKPWSVQVMRNGMAGRFQMCEASIEAVTLDPPE